MVPIEQSACTTYFRDMEKTASLHDGMAVVTAAAGERITVVPTDGKPTAFIQGSQVFLVLYGQIAISDGLDVEFRPAPAPAKDSVAHPPR